MNKLTRISATVASSVALVAGFAGVTSAASIDNSGEDAQNTVRSRNYSRSDVRNNTDLHLTNNNPQTAVTGDVDAEDNDDLGSLTTGSATNDSWTEAHVNVMNSASHSAGASTSDGSGSESSSDGGSLNNDEDDSDNYVSTSNYQSSSVNNDTNVTITNNNSQTAVSGSVNVEDNDDVESLSTGNAMNTSTAMFDVTVSNE